MMRRDDSGGLDAAQATLVHDPLVERYVAEASRLPQVRIIATGPDRSAPSIWTVIDAEPWAPGPRREVYEAELRALDAAAAGAGDFRLINVREYSDVPADQLVPQPAKIRFCR